jgi:hypothetical protein
VMYPTTRIFLLSLMYPTTSTRVGSIKLMQLNGPSSLNEHSE